MASFHQMHAGSRNAYTAKPAAGNLLHEPVLWKLALITAVAYLIWSEKLSIVLNFSPGSAQELLESGGQRVKASLFSDILSTEGSGPAQSLRVKKMQVLLPAEASGNYVYAIDPGHAQRNGTGRETVQAAIRQCRDYVARFAPVAIAEMRKFGIPASIILAQGLLESDAGASKLARGANNHFGIKCFSRRCRQGHCINLPDDSHKDFFVKYGNTWGSYRAHSQHLKNNKRYAPLFNLAPTDYASWARGLAKAGYATDKKYAEKLIALIQNLELHQYDKP